MKSIIRAFNNKKAKNPFAGDLTILTDVISESLFNRRVINMALKKVAIIELDYFKTERLELLNYLEKKSKEEHKRRISRKQKKYPEDDQK